VPDAEESVVELFWSPGSTSSLRMKEFVEKSGIRYESVNLAENPDRMLELRARGINSSAARVGDRYVNGSDLDQLADLIGVMHDPRPILSPRDLVAKYRIITAALKCHINQLSSDLSSSRSPDRRRTVLGLSYHASSVMRIFLREYDPDRWHGEDYHAVMLESLGATDNVSSKELVLKRLDDTTSRFWKWWDECGRADSMNRVVPVYWGRRTLHEALEREVWHTAQHTRQLAALLEDFGVEPAQRLSAQDLAGLPLPKGLSA